jgi:hypothetical protein
MGGINFFYEFFNIDGFTVSHAVEILYMASNIEKDFQKHEIFGRM